MLDRLDALDRRLGLGPASEDHHGNPIDQSWVFARGIGGLMVLLLVPAGWLVTRQVWWVVMLGVLVMVLALTLATVFWRAAVNYKRQIRRGA